MSSLLSCKTVVMVSDLAWKSKVSGSRVAATYVQR